MFCEKCGARYEENQTSCPSCGGRNGIPVPAPSVPYRKPSVSPVVWIVLGVVGGVMCLLAMLAAMLLPALNKARAAAQSLKCVTQLKQLGLVMAMYADDNDNQLPDGDWVTWDEAAIEYGVANCFYCPLNGRKGGESDYLFLGNELDLSQLRRSNRTPLFICRLPDHREGFRNVAFADGHVELVRLPENAGCEEMVRLLIKDAPEQLLANARAIDAGESKEFRELRGEVVSDFSRSGDDD